MVERLHKYSKNGYSLAPDKQTWLSRNSGIDVGSDIVGLVVSTEDTPIEPPEYILFKWKPQFEWN